VATGAALGFATRLVFDAIGFFGGLYSVQAGLGAATAIDPASGASSTAPSALFEGIAGIVYLAIDGHHSLLRAAAISFDALPPGGGGPAVDSLLGVARLGSHVFAVGLQLAAPVTVAMLVANVALGVLGRALPEMNLMMVQIPAHVLFGFGLLLAGASPLGRAIASELAAHSERAFAALLLGSP
jgi:flagellar biosynthetic protein FliR